MSALSKIDTILSEVSRTVVAGEDFIPAADLPLLGTAKDLERIYKKHRIRFLEKMEQQERITSVRLVCNEALELLGVSFAVRDIAVALFGVGECGEKSALTSAKMALAGIPHLLVYANNDPFLHQNPEKEIKQTHQFILTGVNARTIQQGAKAHDLLTVLESCKEGEVVDPLFRFRCQASAIRKQLPFVNYCSRYQITQIVVEEIQEVRETPQLHGLALMDDARRVHATAREIVSRLSKFPFFEGLRGTFIIQKQTELLQGLMQRHFGEHIWMADECEGRVFADVQEGRVSALKAQIEQYGMSCTLSKHPRKRMLTTLAIEHIFTRELYRLELGMTLGSLLNHAAISCISGYLNNSPASSSTPSASALHRAL